MEANDIKYQAALRPEQLKRNVLDTDVESIEESEELTKLVGQERAEKVMRFGLNVQQQGYNMYVAGNSGVGKSTFTDAIVAEYAEEEVLLHDYCYVNNFDDSYRPKMLKLPVGMGKQLKQDMDQLIQHLKEDIPKAFNEETYQKERMHVINTFQDKINHVFETINDIAKQYDLTIRTSGRGFLNVPLINGETITEEEYQKLDQKSIAYFDEQSIALKDATYDHMKQLGELENELKQALTELERKVADSAVGHHIRAQQEQFRGCKDVVTYLVHVKKDIMKNIKDFLPQETNQEKNPLQQMSQQASNQAFEIKYTVNLLVDNSQTTGAPVINADNPNFYNLIGKAEYKSHMGVMSTDFTKIKPGYLHYANGGYVIIQAKDIFTKNYAWESLKYALLNERIQIENIGEHSGMLTTASLKPEPIPLKIKVILIGQSNVYQMLYQHDEDFRKLFKIRVDFDVEMDFTDENMNQLAQFIHTHCKKHDLRHFDQTAVAQVVEYSVRLAANQKKISTQFNHLVEIIYEADAWAKLMNDEVVSEKHIGKAVEEREYRSSLYEEKIQENIEEGTILIDTEGAEVGQVNGLSVHQLGQYSFGRPSRITATTFIGQEGVINIERESDMSGSIHNKGVYILSGYLGQTFAQKHQLSLTTHITFEQLYGGVDGDSASSAELYAILSSLADVPLDQGLAVTGSINQKGIIQPIGGANEKIEGFFEVCKQRGLTGTQGVLIPQQNVNHLMLNEEVIEAVRQGTFHVYQVRTIEEGMAILTGMPSGSLDENHAYEEGSVYRKVADTLRAYAQVTDRESNTVTNTLR